MRILVVEDEIDLLEAIAEGLRIDGYAVDTSEDGEEGLQLAIVNDYDLVILDLNLPNIDGLDILKNIRQNDKLTKILILTARSSIEDRVKGLDLGANDYLIKPFHFDELEARIRCLLRRKFIQEDNELEYNNLKVNTKSRKAYIDNEEIKLTKKEFAILEYLMKNINKAISQEELLEHIWDNSVDMFSNVVRVHINSLRKKLKVKLDEEIIKNVVGVGYIIEKSKGEF
ncbi:response regulator transcription factor [Clostridium sp. CCUG 7971]|uniref:response regulator transcription factor n=1 Tax=Clostridium sp. CCUG 7971 TaxID=2811414 RepID=UPI001ABAC915|nr:response regulator transcription factor [Clostridium sp. CCUG 7971]MBO3444293.1 response regulator transcription factor [Clostridium sp. CCUG 7971]